MNQNHIRNQDKDLIGINSDDGHDDANDIESLSKLGDLRPETHKNYGSGVLFYDNKKYAVGLRWFVAEESADVELATSRAKLIESDFYCFRQNVATQQGFGYLNMGHRIGMPALAANVGDMLVGEWHGVFIADNGWWYMAVHGDNIAPEGDIFFSSEEDAYNHFINQMQAHLWPKAYAPDSWNISGAIGEVALSKLIDEIVGISAYLKPANLDAVFSGKANKNLAVGSMIVITVLLLFSVVGQSMFANLIPTKAGLPVPNIEVADDFQAPPKEASVLDKKDIGDLTSFSLKKPNVFLGQCIESMAQISVSLPGWGIGKTRCTDSFAEVSWVRRIGVFGMIEPYLARFPKNAITTLVDSNALTARLEFAPIPGADRKIEGLYTESYVRTLINNRFEKLGTIVANLVTPAAVTELLSGYAATQEAGVGIAAFGQQKIILKPIQPSDLPYLDVSFQTSTPPNLLTNYFDLSGLVLLSIEGNLLEGEWKYSAKVILKPDNKLLEANIKAKSMQTQIQ
jgi:hypothetical protein